MLSTRKDLEKAAKEAAKKVGSRTYLIKDFETQVPRLILLGCQGIGKGNGIDKTAQEQVADLIETLLRENADLKMTLQPDEEDTSTVNTKVIIIFLGDNHYPRGATEVFSQLFEDCFFKVYNLPLLKKVRCFFLTGNHDGNYREESAYVPTLFVKTGLAPFALCGKSIAFNQHARTYIPEDTTKTIDDLATLFQKQEFYLQELQQYNNPYFFYSLILGKLQLILLDSNSLLKDFLVYHHNQDDPNNLLRNPEFPHERNQIEWLLDTYYQAKKANKEILFLLHHPLIPNSKRAFPNKFDSHHYLTQEERDSLNKIFLSNTDSYNELLYLLFIYLNIPFDGVKFIAAHEHSVSIYDQFQSTTNNNSTSSNFFQLVFAAGGGSKHPRKSFRTHPHLKYFMPNDDYGIGLVSYDNNELIVDIYTTRNHHVQYKNHGFVYQQNVDNNVNQLRKIVLAICNQYLETLKEKEIVSLQKPAQKSTWTYTPTLFSYSYQIASNLISYVGTSAISYVDSCTQSHANLVQEIDCVHTLMSYFNQPQLDDLKTVASFLNTQLNNLVKNNSLSGYQKYTADSLLDLFHKKLFHTNIHNISFELIQPERVTGKPPY